jgi:ribosome-binding factor A
VSNTSPRAQRVADQIQRELATLIQMEVNDPRVGMISVTAVDVSRDLSFANVHVTVMNSLSGAGMSNSSGLEGQGELDKLDIEENLKALNKASGYLRTLLAKKVKLRAVPRIQFHYDDSVNRGHRLSSLIDKALAADQDSHS